MLNVIPPAFILLAGTLLLAVLPQRARAFAFPVFPALALAQLLQLPDGVLLTMPYAGWELVLLDADRLSRVFGTIFALIAFLGGIYGFHLKDRGQQVAAMLYASGVLGVVFAGDWFTLLVFWEIMGVGSLVLIWSRRTAAAGGAGMRYMLVHFTGGSLLLAGILGKLAATGDLSIGLLSVDEWYHWLMMLGVALNAAVPPLHPWLPDAYPRGTVTGSVFMSAFTTKTALYVLARAFAGWDVLYYGGIVMALWGVTYAILANDIRRILSYHIVSQVGYMVTAVGIGTEFALNGATAHAFSHILYKALLFMGTGAVLQATGRSKMTELGGLLPQLKWVFVLYMVAAFSISGAPLTNGFISKSMVIAAAGEAHHYAAVLLLLLASVGTFLSVGLKLPAGTWFGAKPADITVQPLPRNMYVGMGITAFLCILYGVWPTLLYNQLPTPVDYAPYSIAHLVEIANILVLTFVAYWIFRKKLAPHDAVALDVDFLYRKPAPLVRTVTVMGTNRVFAGFERATLWMASALAGLARNPAPALQSLLIGRKSANRREYNADDARPRLQYVMGLVLLVFVLGAYLGLR